MFALDIPGFGQLRLAHLVTDFTGTLSVDGRLLPGVKEGLHELAETVQIHVLTADTFGMARAELAGIGCTVNVMTCDHLDQQKLAYVEHLGAGSVIALGNGKNDRLMLRAAKVGVAVCLAEGCAKDAMEAADILVTSPLDAFRLLTTPNRLKATMRF